MSMSQWIKCDEEMPSRNTSCIVYRCDMKKPVPCNMYWDGDVWIPDGYGFDTEESWRQSQISHWMPLPAPPSEDQP
ncbi:DUF551 domain-containing protein [Pseudomonas hormoni]